MYNLPAINSNISKSELNIIAEHSVKEILDNKNVLEVAGVIARMEYLMKEIKSNADYVDHVRNEIALYGKETNYNGVKLALAEVGSRYNFTKCGDSILAELEQKKEMIEEQIKQRQQFLKSLPSEGMEVVNGDTIEKIYPPSKISTSSFKVTIQK